MSTTIAQTQLTARGDRLLDNIKRLAKIGQQPDGSICRLAFSPADLQARYLVQQWMIDAGMTTRTDPWKSDTSQTWARFCPQPSRS
jgi:N-carbamoyl-L-amino-acid hydrolase